jgi:hypothetical protein
MFNLELVFSAPEGGFQNDFFTKENKVPTLFRHYIFSEQMTAKSSFDNPRRLVFVFWF